MEILCINICNHFVAVLIICSPLNSPITNRIVNRFKHYRHAKLLLIDIIGNVFSYKRPFLDDENITNTTTTTSNKPRDNLLVLTILTQKFKYILDSEYHVEFSQYLNFKEETDSHRNETKKSCLVHNKRIHYDNLSSCEHEIRERCQNHSVDVDVAIIRNFCMRITSKERKWWSGGGVQLNDSTFSKQLVFSEHFNLFDFITSTSMMRKRNSTSKIHHQFDFIVLDFKSIFNNKSVVSWRPLMILEQSDIDGNAFTMHHANFSSTYDVDELVVIGLGWFKSRCGSVCYAIIAAIFLIFLGLIFIISIMVGIAAR